MNNTYKNDSKGVYEYKLYTLFLAGFETRSQHHKPNIAFFIENKLAGDTLKRKDE